jgi:uncharacterized protein YycO
MAKFIILFLLIFNARTFALESGDLILQPLACWTCSLIEAQEKSPYSHIGIYIEKDGEGFVFEAYSKVQLVPLSEYLKKTEKGIAVKIKRFKNINFTNEDLLKAVRQYIGFEYDREFLWNNYNQYGKQKIYCSELVYLVFQKFYQGLPLKRMQFDINTIYWERYFGGNVPFNEWGVSPEDFNQSSLLKDVEYEN